MSQVAVTQTQNQHTIVCQECGREFTHREYLDHLFRDKDCMRAYWHQEERMHAYNVRHRSLNRKRERELQQARTVAIEN